ncbi:MULTISPECIES: arginase family protein [unclassified Mesorhizobium]|uniref:arginase family protein n=1 Tax=unclassified Mesorhizobium TaxID=325217 RepID=UPI000FE9B1AE|nr:MULTISPECIES: arginase family protein [unclassified Mesorhizobium]RWB26165.1 MAG: arginase family protein [Mesorhizobium sp.]RWB29430.1 MAG: arginase family protein [Mesorhizobium sp.]RWB63262.1 MAG: arginase family protein [Mesorhizobium sp.]RWC20804.1 MAG: arginase family protein [Mesorhizobium sp.]RWD15739.1 MAG: arginase family protein [Mesorhizobium sp.]
MKLSIILAPYDSGLYHAGCGQGPDAIIAGGLVDELAFRGHDVVVEDIGEVGDAQKREIATGFAVCRAVATKVDMARDDERFPIVLTGNCLTAAGAVAGDTADSIIWIDQHGDLNTPETSAYGFLDGMALATTLGLCWRPMTSAIPGFQAIDPSRCVLVDARDLDPDERRLLETLPIIRAHWADALDNVGKLKAAGAAQVHLHLDLDVHDPDVLQVNRYARPGGPNPEQLRQLVCGLAKSIPIVGVTLSAYDPAFDAKGEVPPVVGQLLGDFLAALARI